MTTASPDPEVAYDPEEGSYALPAEHAACLPRAA
jgi:hypothetical protein